jgi:hypothetical protein
MRMDAKLPALGKLIAKVIRIMYPDLDKQLYAKHTTPPKPSKTWNQQRNATTKKLHKAVLLLLST